ncbi:MAG: helix-turn-helix transcriptional regulator [Exilibacterium sp.]
MTIFVMPIPGKLSQIRKEKGLSQQALADAIGLHVNQIKRYETGSSQPSLDTLKKISKALRVSIDSLVFDDEETGPSEALRLQFEAISRMPEEEQQIILELLEGMIIKYETRRWSTQRRN